MSKISDFEFVSPVATKTSVVDVLLRPVVNNTAEENPDLWLSLPADDDYALHQVVRRAEEQWQSAARCDVLTWADFTVDVVDLGKVNLMAKAFDELSSADADMVCDYMNLSNDPLGAALHAVGNMDTLRRAYLHRATSESAAAREYLELAGREEDETAYLDYEQYGHDMRMSGELVVGDYGSFVGLDSAERDMIDYSEDELIDKLGLDRSPWEDMNVMARVSYTSEPVVDPGTVLSDTAFVGVTFSQAMLESCEFDHCAFDHCEFSECDLSEVKFSDCYVFNTAFEDCTFTNVDTTTSEVSDVEFTNSELVGVTMEEGSNVVWSDCVFDESCKITSGVDGAGGAVDAGQHTTHTETAVAAQYNAAVQATVMAEQAVTSQLENSM